MNDAIGALRADLRRHADPAVKRGARRFFKEGEGLALYGVRGADLHRIAGRHWPSVRPLSKRALFRLCGELLRSGLQEEAAVAAIWLPKLADRFARSDLAVFRGWILRRVDNWAKCDSLCTHAVGDFLLRFPEAVVEVKAWTASRNRWLRRAAAVSLVLPARRGLFLRDVFDVAERLLEDPDDMVRKGYGWMLKEAGRAHEAEVFEYVLRRRPRMPRTALRYAIELMPKERRAEALRKDA
jgi:3-methyladenine DNA glycosylase AlkD